MPQARPGETVVSYSALVSSSLTGDTSSFQLLVAMHLFLVAMHVPSSPNI